MHSAAHFDQVLAEKLGHVGPNPAAPPPRVRPLRRPDPVVLFFDTGARVSPAPVGRVTGAYGPGHRPAEHLSAAPPPRPARVLSARQEQALADLAELGATLSADFTARELKGTFRALARIYHPDRHPGCSEFERARLARQFATLSDAYRRLLTLVDLPPAA
jgi:hypothetical protein